MLELIFLFNKEHHSAFGASVSHTKCPLGTDAFRLASVASSAMCGTEELENLLDYFHSTKHAGKEEQLKFNSPSPHLAFFFPS